MDKDDRVKAECMNNDLARPVGIADCLASDEFTDSERKHNTELSFKVGREACFALDEVRRSRYNYVKVVQQVEEQMERSLIIIKPDGVQRRLVGEIISRIEKKGLKLAAMKLVQVDRELAEKHYAVHKGKKFYESLVSFITSGPVVAMAVEGPNAIAVMRKLMGKTFGFEAEGGTIRGDFSVSTQFNLVHGSDGPETAEKELSLWFEEKDYVSCEMPDEKFCKLQ